MFPRKLYTKEGSPQKASLFALSCDKPDGIFLYRTCIAAFLPSAKPKSLAKWDIANCGQLIAFTKINTVHLYGTLMRLRYHKRAALKGQHDALVIRIEGA